MSDEEAIDEAVPGDPSPPKRMSDEDYKVAIELYERGEASLADLSEEYGISRNALYKRFRNDNIQKNSKVAVVAAEKVVEKFIERRSDWIEETRFSGYQALKQVQLIARKVVLDQIKLGPGARLGAVDDDLKAIGRLNKILCDNVLTSLKILNADDHIDEANLPTLVIEDLTDQEVLDHHKSTGAMDMDATLEDMLRESLEEEDD